MFEHRYRVMVRQCLADDPTFGVVLIERGSEVGGGDSRTGFGTIARIETAVELSDGRFALECRGADRLRVCEWLEDDPYPQADVEVFDEAPSAPTREVLDRAASAVRRAWVLLSELGATSPSFPLGGAVSWADSLVTSTAALSAAGWEWCALAPIGPFDRLGLLGIDDPESRLDHLCHLADAVSEDARRMLSDGAT